MRVSSINVVLPHGPPHSGDVPRGGTYAAQDIRESKGDPVELADYLRILRNHWIAVTAFILVAAVAAFGWSSIQPKVYAASSSGFVTSGGGGDPGLDSLNDSCPSRARRRTSCWPRTARPPRSSSTTSGSTPRPRAWSAASTPPRRPTPSSSPSPRAPAPRGARSSSPTRGWARSRSGSRASRPASQRQPGHAHRGVGVGAAPDAPGVAAGRAQRLLGAVLGALLGLGYAVRPQPARPPHPSSRGHRARHRRPRRRLGARRRQEPPASSSAPAPATPRLAAEGVRRLRTNLSYMDVDNPPRAIVVTSPSRATASRRSRPTSPPPSRLRSARHPRRRRPAPAHARPRLGVDDTVGLTDVLAGRLELADALQHAPDHRGPQRADLGPHRPTPARSWGRRPCGRHRRPDRQGDADHRRPSPAARDRRRRRRARRRRRFIVVSAGRTLDTRARQRAGPPGAPSTPVRSASSSTGCRKRTVGAGNYGHYGYGTDDYVESTTGRRKNRR